MIEWKVEYILFGVIAFQWLVYLWNEYLTFRQRRVVKRNKTVPQELSHVLDQETLEKARLYSLDKSTFGFWQGLWGEIEMTIILLLFALPWLWDVSGNVMVICGLTGDHEIVQSLIFMFFGSIYSLISGLPWSIYSTFVIEARHNFNKQTPGFFIKDTLKKFVVMLLIGMPILALLIYIVKIGGEYFFVYAWLFTLVFSLLLITIYPSYIAPLFDKFTKLPDGTLRTEIEKLADSVKFPLTELYLIEGSKRSAHSNAYFVGLIKKRIVLFDTLLAGFHPDNKPKEAPLDNPRVAQDGEAEPAEPRPDEPLMDETKSSKTLKGCTDEEALAVLGHELGHWKLWHMPKNFLISNINTLLCFAVFGLLYQRDEIYQAFGFENSKPILIGMFIIFQFIFGPYDMVLSFCMVILSRRFEFQADEFAIKLEKEGKLNNGGELLKSALLQLQKDNLSFPYTDWLFSTFNYSHPPILDRFRGIDEAKKRLLNKAS